MEKKKTKQKKQLTFEQKYPLHKVAETGDIEKIRSLVNKYDINERDQHGNTPLHIAIHFRNVQLVEELLQLGADPTFKNGGGWSPLNEAVAARSKQLVVLLYQKLSEHGQKEYYEKVPRLVSALKSIPDFYLELKWEFKCKIPFLTYFCPHDTYKIHKKGSSIRVDTTLTGFQNMRWQRGDVSFLFLGEKSETPGAIVLMDNQKKTVEYALKTLKEHTEQELNEMASQLLNSSFSMTKTNFRYHNVNFTPRRGWFGGEKEEMIGGFNSKIFDMEGLEMETKQRKRDPTANIQMQQPKLYPENYWDRATDDPKGKGYGLLWDKEDVSTKTKEHKCTVWLAKDFPRKISELLPILEILAPTMKHFGQLKEFLELKFPDYGFPIKIEIPLVPTIYVSVTFLFYEERHISGKLFKIPESYSNSLVKMDFDFTGTEELNSQQLEGKDEIEQDVELDENK